MKYILSPRHSVTSWDIWAWRFFLQSGLYYSWSNSHVLRLFYPWPQKAIVGAISSQNICFKHWPSKVAKTKMYWQDCGHRCDVEWRKVWTLRCNCLNITFLLFLHQTQTHTSFKTNFRSEFKTSFLPLAESPGVSLYMYTPETCLRSIELEL